MCISAGQTVRVVVRGLESQLETPAPDRVECGARTRAGGKCRRAPLKGKTRCRNHGGKSTGPRTDAGRELIRASNRRRAAERRGRSVGDSP